MYSNIHLSIDARFNNFYIQRVQHHFITYQFKVTQILCVYHH